MRLDCEWKDLPVEREPQPTDRWLTMSEQGAPEMEP